MCKNCNNCGGCKTISFPEGKPSNPADLMERNLSSQEKPPSKKEGSEAR